MVLSEVVIT